MWQMLQQDEPEDYVVASGECHSVREFLQLSFECVGLDYKSFLVIDENLYRPSEVNILQGDASKAKKRLDWYPKVSFQELVKEMVEGDLAWFSSTKNNLFA
jgi:GDPmannose 4,6-dehydratase